MGIIRVVPWKHAFALEVRAEAFFIFCFISVNSFLEESIYMQYRGLNELREQCSIPRICLTDQQILELIDTRAKAAGADTLTATAEYIAPLAGAEWTKHRDDVLWNPDEAKKKAKEEDEKRNKEALAAKFAHIKDDPGKETVEL